jgi:polysaccharide pyruvyl transferase WcaK-like protein
VRIHLGHHFYGAGNLGDDFMLAGFLAAMRTIAPDASYSCSVPFPLAPLRNRFPTIEWHPYDDDSRMHCIRECDFWLGLGGSPFQSARSRWFIDHLVVEAERCAQTQTPMFFLGVGVQTADELSVPDVRRICAQAAGVWTRDHGSTERIRSLPSAPPVETSADLSHIFFRRVQPPPAIRGRFTLVPNFDFGEWPGQAAVLDSVRNISATERVWLAQESRDLPGAERALYAQLPLQEQSRWQFMSPEMPGENLPAVLGRWPSGEWLVTARYHSALAGAWAGSKIVIITTNEKLRAAAAELHAPVLAPNCDENTVRRALETASPATAPHELADAAQAACAALIRSAVAHRC